MNILVVEDERNLADAICRILEDEGYNAEAAYDGKAGLAYAESCMYDAAILDVMLPGMDGFEIVRELRRAGSELPVMMLTAKTSTADKVEGLDCGADDYMTKPFEAPELLARVRALTRRKGEMVIDTLTFGDLTLDLSSHDLACGEQSVHLSKREFDVLQMLMKGTNRIVSKQDLLTRVWGTDADASENSVEAYVSFLRKKIRHLKSKVEITTLRMLGYRLEVME
ncbi:response regulator transcription factor [uncultured Parolsenella sp.]|uniref:response regulator transcription factor n=1 Tax=uncultured Parolsenella sp. TaxID=2083008 RepID=UPI0025EE9E5E|nr:response regulator transcription factor [uncultured Parolsenella sp.]